MAQETHYTTDCQPTGIHSPFRKVEPGKFNKPFITVNPKNLVSPFINTETASRNASETDRFEPKGITMQEEISAFGNTSSMPSPHLSLIETEKEFLYFHDDMPSRPNEAPLSVSAPFRKGIPIPKETLTKTIEKIINEQLHYGTAAFPSIPNYQMTENGIFWINQETHKRECLCNYQIIPQIMVENMDGDTLSFTSIKFSISLCGQSHSMIVEASKVDNLAKIISDAYPAAIVYIQSAKAEQRIIEFFRSCLPNLPTITIQRKVGWFTFQGKKIFAHDGRPPAKDEPTMQTGKIILSTSQGQQGLYDTFLSALSLGSLKAIAPMIATCLLAPLYPLFEEANKSFIPRFCLFINGPSGSLKTSVSQVFFNIFNSDTPYVPATFNDTATALELRLKELPNSPILIDDFYSTGLSANRNEMQGKLEKVIRFIGDGIGKNRSNAGLQDVKGTRPSGTVAITGEDTAGQMSTLLRCMIICVDRTTFNKEVLTSFQNSPTKWSSFVAEFLCFIEKNYQPIVTYITKNYLALRDYHKKDFKDFRPVDQLVQIALAFHILEIFLNQSVPGNLDTTELIQSCVEACRIAVKESQAYASQNSSEHQYAFTLAKLIAEDKIILADSRKTYSSHLHEFDGFTEQNFLYLNSDSVFSKVRQNFQQQGREFPLSLLNANRALYYANLLIPEIEKKGTENEKRHLEVKVRIGQKRPRMLKIDRAAFRAYTDSEN